ncbi:MAG: hypothetical protein NC203_07190 [Firmicutes bacterium]|nr:hypothetical protein [Bacillota bacterium]
MKHKKITFSIAALLAISLLTACNNGGQTASPQDSHTEAAAPNTEITSETADLAVSTTEATDPDIPAETGISVTVEGDPREFTLIGTPHGESEFVDFTYEELYDRICEKYNFDSRWDDEAGTTKHDPCPYREKNDAMFDSLGVPEIKELYLKASALWYFFQDGEAMWDIAFDAEDTAQLLTPNNRGSDDSYRETGVSSDGFLSALHEVYTEEAVKEMLERFPWYVFYNGEVFNRGLSSVIGPAAGAELVLVSQTDGEIVIRSVLYQGITVHTPHSGEVENPEVYKFDNRFVKTEKGWRTAEIATVVGSSLDLRYQSDNR